MQHLLEAGQEHLFAKWPKPGTPGRQTLSSCHCPHQSFSSQCQKVTSNGRAPSSGRLLPLTLMHLPMSWVGPCHPWPWQCPVCPSLMPLSAGTCRQARR